MHLLRKLQLQIQAKPLAPGTVHGLANKVNSCWMNAAIQCLMSLELLNKALFESAREQYYKPGTVSADYIAL